MEASTFRWILPARLIEIAGGFATYLVMWGGLLDRQSPHSDNGKSERTARRIAGSLNGCHAGPHFSGNGGPILGRAKATAAESHDRRDQVRKIKTG